MSNTSHIEEIKGGIYEPAAKIVGATGCIYENFHKQPYKPDMCLSLQKLCLT
ncbi:8995_t:CDS:2 [Cetraspora pellucida]|uniref:8995_t:CDS:1 n=1 Tax=Cetraspora pellucida TaxID=1433469 RepID=A0A9N9HZH5_9GLOM|nr:8995_t:CDS:2 [Cetraspora pellucida]